jgi:cytochrome c-type protein NapB
MTEDGTLLQEGKHVDNIGDIKSVAKPLETLSNARFNCSACHAPQSTATEAPKNTFKPEFRSKDANSKSNLINNINDGVK